MTQFQVLANAPVRVRCLCVSPLITPVAATVGSVSTTDTFALFLAVIIYILKEGLSLVPYLRCYNDF